MATLLLDVPLDEQTQSDTCWHSAAYMIWLYWQRKTGRQGPMWTLPQHYADNRPVSPQDFIRLAKNVGMREVERLKQYTNENLKKMLEGHGPLWCAGWWFGPGHVIVLTGVTDDLAHINDPDGGVRKRIPLQWFNTKLANQLPGCLMSKNPAAY
jgi:hypothetical protein